MHLRQPGFTYGTCAPFTKHHERIQNFKVTDDLKHIYKNKLDKACFAHDRAYSDSKDLAKRTVSDNLLKDSAYEIAINLKYDGYQRRLASIVYKFFDKKTGSGDARFEDNMWAANLAEMGSLSSKNQDVIC